MRLKSFYAKTMTEAMQIVRDTLGEDAIIVATREENGGKSVRVTAAVEYADDRMDREENTPSKQSPEFELNDSKIKKNRDQLAEDIDQRDLSRIQEMAKDWLQYDDEEDEEGLVIEYLTDTLLQHSVPGDVLDNIISTATMVGYDTPSETLAEAFEHVYNFLPLPKKPSRKAFMLIGAPGAGKTLASAKLAARYVMDGYKVGVITTDIVRAGGVEQLEAFTKLLKADLRRAKDDKELAAHIKDLHDKVDQIIIDTGGSNPYDVDDMRNLAKMINCANIEPILVLQSGLDADESAELARSYALLGVQRIMPTRLDLARRFGGLLAAAQKSGLAFTDASNTYKVANGLTDFNPQGLMQLFIPNKKSG
jgi:flagellar biosynthesis protein FlhF